MATGALVRYVFEMRISAALSLTIAACLAVSTKAAEVMPPDRQQSLTSFADANTGCHEWSDGCAVCIRTTDGRFGCSLPGVACQPGVLACRDPGPGR